MPEWKRAIEERLTGLWLDAARRIEIVQELSQHLDDRYRELCAGGADADTARRDALAELDDQDLVGALAAVEAAPGLGLPLGDVRRGRLAASVWQDLRYAARVLRKNPGFTLVAILTLALGIGATTAIFSVVNGVVLRPLPYAAPDRLVVIWGNLHRPGLDEIPGSAGEYVDYRDRTRAFEVVAAYDTDGFNLTGSGDPERIEGAVVTPTLFPLLGVTAQIGRTFLPEEDQPGREQVVVLSYGLWTRRFHSDRAIVGRAVTVDGKPVQVVGVMPAGFQFPNPSTELWKPILLDADAVSDNNRGSHGYTVLARMRGGVPGDRAQADLDAITATFKTEHPNNYKSGFSTSIRPLHDEIVGDTSRPLYVLLGAVGLVLLIACANVANLTLARAASRGREIALRTALGASRGRLLQQLLTENVLLALLGGVAGLVAASWGVRLLIAAAPDAIPRLHEVSVDGRVVAFSTVMSLATGLLFGMAPAIRASRTQLNDSLKDGGRSSDAAMHRRAGGALVISEVALSLVLLIAAGLLVHSFVKLQDVEPGFEPSHLLTFGLSLPAARYTTFDEGDAFFENLFRSLQSTPGVTSAAAINALPFSGVGGSRSFYIEGREIKRPEDQPEEQVRFATHGYFETMQIPLREGRTFSMRDTRGGARVAVVNDAFARKHFPNGGAIGARVSFSRDAPVWYEVVGVVGDIKHRGLDAATRPELYTPYRQPLFADWTVRPMHVVVRTATDPLAALTIVRHAIARLDPDQPISDVRTMDARIDRSLKDRRFNMVLLAAFASFALTLAAIGIYGIVAYSVTERTHEIGVRVALGAQRHDIMRMVVRQGMTMTLIGTAGGLAAAFGVTRVMSTLLFGVSAADPITFAVIPVLLLAVAAWACYVPARRATRVDPIVALRCE
jgi:putative ABC transport system permease protein